MATGLLQKESRKRQVSLSVDGRLKTLLLPLVGHQPGQLDAHLERQHQDDNAQVDRRRHDVPGALLAHLR